MLLPAKSLQLIFYFLFPFTKRREPEKKKETQEIENERWARLDNLIERARARHELARLGMGTIFLVIIIIIIIIIREKENS